MPLANSHHDLLGQRRLTSVHGENVTLYKANVCSCRGSDGEHALPTCKACGGTGRAYQAGQLITGLIATISNQDKTLLQSGLAMPADLTFSPDLTNGIVVHDYDVIRLAYGMPYEGDVLTRGGDNELSYVPLEIERIVSYNPNTGASSYYWSGYTVTDKAVTWEADYGPPNGQNYSVIYTALIDWIVYPGVTLPRIVRGDNLGQRVLLRKRHLAGIHAIVPNDRPPIVVAGA